MNNNVLIQIDDILKKRYHGASSLAGFRYQILYSILKGLDLIKQKNDNDFIRVEGIDDLDVCIKTEQVYVQLKHYVNGWNWNKLATKSINNKGKIEYKIGVIENFAEVFKVNGNCRFEIITQYKFDSKLQRIIDIDNLTPKKLNELEQDFYKICSSFKRSDFNLSFEESKKLLRKISLKIVSESDILDGIKSNLESNLEINVDTSDIYLTAFVGFLTDWAVKQRTVPIKASDLIGYRMRIGEGISKEQNFKAFAEGWISKLNNIPDEKELDFYEGKQTRYGHIIKNLDVRREKWHKKIDEVLEKYRICIIKSSSGQGKSTLMYRYAYENWNNKNILLLRSADTDDKVLQIKDYLQLRYELGQPVCLLIDNINWKTKEWAEIAKTCASLGFYILATIRSEDWYRYKKESLTTYEIIEPTFDLDEAMEIFNKFELNNKISESLEIKKAEWAYEKIKEPKLLIEFVYFITQGKMLEERLKEQIEEINKLPFEDHSKIEILRRVSLANSNDVPVDIDKLLDKVEINKDPQFILDSLKDEFIRIEDNLIYSLHWVRSDHLTQLLHNEYISYTKTAINVFESIPDNNISSFIANVLNDERLNTSTFLDYLINLSNKEALEKVLSILDGLFEAGEKIFFESNKDYFNELIDLFRIGNKAHLFVTCMFSPIISDNSIVSLLEEHGNNPTVIQRIKEIEEELRQKFRGIDLCKKFLTCYNPDNITISENKLSPIGILLDWFYLCKIDSQNIPNNVKSSIDTSSLLDLPIEELGIFLQGLYRYDQEIYMNWFHNHIKQLISYLKYYVDCIKIEIEDNELYTEFIVKEKEGFKSNDLAVKRLEILRTMIPFCSKYKSKGILLLPYGLEAPVDDTIKNMDPKYLPLETDIKKNKIFQNIVEAEYDVNTFYEYAKNWHNLRFTMLTFINELVKYVKNLFRQEKINNIDKIILNIIELDILLKKEYSSEKLEQIYSIENIENLKHWLRLLEIFFLRFNNFLKTKDNDDIKIAYWHFMGLFYNLDKMHLTFDKIFLSYPDYFNSTEINKKELTAYRECAYLLEAWYCFPPKVKLSNIKQYIEHCNAQKKQRLLSKLKEVFIPLIDEGIDIILPLDIYTDFSDGIPLTYLPIAYSIDNVDNYEMFQIIKALEPINDLANFYCLIPLYNDKQILKDGYRIYQDSIPYIVQHEKFENWTQSCPTEFSDNIKQLLPKFEYEPPFSFVIQIKSEGIKVLLDIMQKYLKIIEPFENSEDEYEQKLYYHKLAELAEMRDKIMKEYQDLKLYFVEMYEKNNYTKEDDYYDCINELDKVFIALDSTYNYV